MTDTTAYRALKYHGQLMLEAGDDIDKILVPGNPLVDAALAESHRDRRTQASQERWVAKQRNDMRAWRADHHDDAFRAGVSRRELASGAASRVRALATVVALAFPRGFTVIVLLYLADEMERQGTESPRISTRVAAERLSCNHNSVARALLRLERWFERRHLSDNQGTTMTLRQSETPTATHEPHAPRSLGEGCLTLRQHDIFERVALGQRFRHVLPALANGPRTRAEMHQAVPGTKSTVDKHLCRAVELGVCQWSGGKVMLVAGLQMALDRAAEVTGGAALAQRRRERHALERAWFAQMALLKADFDERAKASVRRKPNGHLVFVMLAELDLREERRLYMLRGTPVSHEIAAAAA